MKKVFCLGLAGLVALSVLVSCGSAGPKKVTAQVAKDSTVVALVVEYSEAIAEGSINPLTYVVEGKEIAGVIVTDKDPLAKPEAPKPGEGKPEPKGPEGAPAPQPGQPGPGPQPGGPAPEGAPAPQPGAPAPEGAPAPQPDALAPEGAPAPQPGQPAPGPEAQPGGPAPAPAPKGGKYVIVLLKDAAPACCQEGADSAAVKPCCQKEGSPCCQGGDKPCCKEGAPAEGECPAEAPECCKETPDSTACCGEAPEIAVPDIAIQQVAEVATVDGKNVKAWSKPVKATAAVPAAPCKKGPKGPGQPGPQPGGPAPEGAPAPQPGPAPQPKAE